eukprot:3914091-Amphidinium_carterae.1
MTHTPTMLIHIANMMNCPGERWRSNLPLWSPPHSGAALQVSPHFNIYPCSCGAKEDNCGTRRTGSPTDRRPATP